MGFGFGCRVWVWGVGAHLCVRPLRQVRVTRVDTQVYPYTRAEGFINRRVEMQNKEEVVERDCLLFEAGEYPDKGVSISEGDIIRS